ncbi:hypothetical protein BD413DRAFT_493111 [Trametes elegans]|nr:hypothetical protein BD413DRAFT_493111 [Trametes elegans]
MASSRSTSPFPPEASDPDATPYNARRRRTSMSGKLLGLFAPKPKSHPAAPSQRPVISRPYPLERRALSPTPPSACPQSYTRNADRKKRTVREASLDLDENNPGCASGTGPGVRRAFARPRIDSGAPSRTVTLLGPNAPAPLKSALKNAGFDVDMEPEPRVRATAASGKKGRLASAEGASPHKGVLKATTGHNRGAPAVPPSDLAAEKVSRTRDKRRLGKGISWLPFPGAGASTSTSSQGGDTSGTPARTRSALLEHPKKSVKFADEDDMASLKRSRTLLDIEDAIDLSLGDIEMDLDEQKPSSSASTATSSPRRTVRGPRRKPSPPLHIFPDSSRVFKPLPVPQQTGTSDKQSTVRAIVEQRKESDARDHADFRTLLASKAPPTPQAALKREPFTLRPSSSGSASPLHRGESTTPPAAPPTGSRLMPKDILETVLDGIERDREERRRKKTGVPPTRFRPGSRGVMQRFNVDIVPDKRHVTIWDGSDGDIYAWSGTLVVRDAKPTSYFYPRHSIHDLLIQFHTVSEPRADPSTFDPVPGQAKYEWQAVYSGQRVPAATRTPSGEVRAPTLDRARGIAVEREYTLAENPPSVDGPATWLVRFWVPVPLALFARGAEHRTFVCRARVTVRDWQTPQTDVPGGDQVMVASIHAYAQSSSDGIERQRRLVLVHPPISAWSTIEDRKDGVSTRVLHEFREASSIDLLQRAFGDSASTPSITPLSRRSSHRSAHDRFAPYLCKKPLVFARSHSSSLYFHGRFRPQMFVASSFYRLSEGCSTFVGLLRGRNGQNAIAARTTPAATTTRAKTSSVGGDLSRLVEAAVVEDEARTGAVIVDGGCIMPFEYVEVPSLTRARVKEGVAARG